MSGELRLCLAEPWFGESHAALFAGIARHSRHQCQLVTLPARRWRWRMRLGSLHLAAAFRELDPWPEALIASDYVNLPALIGLDPRVAALPTAIYFLENQLTYPPRKGERGDFEFMAMNVLSCLAADRCVFCSGAQLEALLEALPGFLAHDADARPDEVAEAISSKSQVIPIGVELHPFDVAREAAADRSGQPLRIAWPHRFEHDKNPDDFFAVLEELSGEGLPFEVAVLGKGYRDLPESMSRARETLSEHVVHWGFLEGEAYAEALAASDVVVSTAWQETQGIAVIESIRAGCDPLLPDRLSYPELLGAELAEKHLFSGVGDLRRRLRWMMRHPDRLRGTKDHSVAVERFGWDTVAPAFDELARELACEGESASARE